jgi:hypothetical protein
MTAYSLAYLRDRARETADMGGSTYVADSVIQDVINESIRSLYRKLADQGGPDWNRTVVELSTSAGNPLVFLPLDFYSLAGVDLESEGEWCGLHQLDFSQRNETRTWPQDAVYQLQQPNNSDSATSTAELRLFPTPTTALPVRVWYFPVPAPLIEDTALIQLFLGAERYVILDVAISLRIRQEMDVQALMVERQRAEEDAIAGTQRRDRSATQKLRDTRKEREGGRRW